MRITRIEQRRQKLDAVYIDGEFMANLDRETLALSGLGEGSEVSEEQLGDLIAGSDRKRAKEKALWLLSHRSHTKAELLEKVARSTSAEAAKEAVARMGELGMVDDADYGRRYALELAERRGYAARRIIQELRRKGIETALIEEIIEGLELDASEQIRTLLDRKYTRALLSPNGKSKVIASLQRYGYSWSEIQPCLEAWLAEQATEVEAEDEEEFSLEAAGDFDDRIRYLLETKYSHSLGNEKDRRRSVNALVTRGFSRLQVERVMREVCGLDQEEDHIR